MNCIHLLRNPTTFSSLAPKVFYSFLGRVSFLNFKEIKYSSSKTLIFDTDVGYEEPEPSVAPESDSSASGIPTVSLLGTYYNCYWLLSEMCTVFNLEAN